jgi:hypothetical protein
MYFDQLYLGFTLEVFGIYQSIAIDALSTPAVGNREEDKHNFSHQGKPESLGTWISWNFSRLVWHRVSIPLNFTRARLARPFYALWVGHNWNGVTLQPSSTPLDTPRHTGRNFRRKVRQTFWKGERKGREGSHESLEDLKKEQQWK